jgi:hypothetical protein
MCFNIKICMDGSVISASNIIIVSLKYKGDEILVRKHRVPNGENWFYV